MYHSLTGVTPDAQYLFWVEMGIQRSLKSWSKWYSLYFQCCLFWFWDNSCATYLFSNLKSNVAFLLWTALTVPLELTVRWARDGRRAACVTLFSHPCVTWSPPSNTHRPEGLVHGRIPSHSQRNQAMEKTITKAKVKSHERGIEYIYSVNIIPSGLDFASVLHKINSD